MAPDSRGLVVDFGGVLTTSLDHAFRAFCEREDVDSEALSATLREAYGAADADSFVARFETGRLERGEFERLLAAALSEGLGRPLEPSDLVARMLADLRLDPAMAAAVRNARLAGIRTALLSNSWGSESYPDDLLDELFDEVVISGHVGLRKPDPQVFLLACRRIALTPRACVFVDDWRPNVEAAEAVGMRGVLHEETPRTIAELERVLEVRLDGAADTM
ncbi:MAG: HAD family hydrolase [Actinomycetota bacterium]